MTQMSFDFSAPRHTEMPESSNDYHHLPVSENQVRFARKIAADARISVPESVLTDRREMSAWIDAHKSLAARKDRFATYPSSKQVAFAERIARIKRRAVPNECFKDRTLMSRWIDSNL